MLKAILVILLPCFTALCFAQSSRKETARPNGCGGAINIFNNDDYTLQFTGEKSGALPSSYPSLAAINSDNLLWVTYIAPAKGELTFDATIENGSIQMVIFEEGKMDICDAIKEGASEIKRLYLANDRSKIGLGYEVGNGFQYALELQAGQKINVLFSTKEGSTATLPLHWQFNEAEEVISESKIIDRRDDDFAPTFSILIKDRETNQPIIANISLTSSSNISGVYSASELYFNLSKNSKIAFKCDADGYFFNDREESVSSTEDVEIIILMDKIAAGKSLQIEEIEFVPGTSEITSSSEPKLRRLYEFLALNSSLEIEIQGHVFAIGENSIAGQKISEARAKRVMKYLIDRGIDKKRLTAVGYGNTRPIYPEPVLSYEEQANRRVEIVIK